MGRSSKTNTERLRTFLGIATALWLIGAIAAVIDGDTLTAVAWFCLVAFGTLSVSGWAHRSRGIAYLAIGVLVVGVGILMGIFLLD